MHKIASTNASLLEQAAEAFSQWRATRTGRSRIPEHLWDMACQVARTHGVAKTSQTLKLDYYGLQRRVSGPAARSSKSTRSAKKRAASESPAFVELPPVSTVVQHTECELEFENGRGTKLTLRWQGSSAPDLATLCQLIRQA